MKLIKTHLPIRRYISKVSLYVTFVLLVLLFTSMFFALASSKEERLNMLRDSIANSFKAELNFELVDLLSFSLALSEDGELKNSLIDENELVGRGILAGITSKFKEYTHLKTLRLQVLTPDFFIFARSWDEGYEGMPIWWFRDDLAELRKNVKPKAGVETGRLLTLKATIPIYSSSRLLGYLEVIKFTDELTSKLRKKGIELFVMMSEKHLDKAELMSDFPAFGGFVVANQNYNHEYLEKMKKLDLKNFFMKSYYFDNHILHLNVPMINGKGEQIGHYILSVPDDLFDWHDNTRQNKSLFTHFSDDDIKSVVKAWSTPYGSFESIYDKELIMLLPKLKKEDKLDLEDEAKSILNSYDKNSLIDIIIGNRYNEKKQGEIR